MKVCTKCGEAKPLSDYGKHRKSSDGLNQQCLPCQRENRRQSAAKSMQDPEKRKAVRARQAKWAKQWRAENPESAREQSRDAYHRDLERSREASRLSEAKRRAEKPEETRAAARAAYRRVATETSASAIRNGAAWGEDEDGLARDLSLSVREVAKRVGRSYASVRARRNVLLGRVDPLEGGRKDRRRTLPTATNLGKEWTGVELELLADYSRSAVELAMALGRTADAVEAQRKLLKTDPRKRRLAGK